MGNNLSLSEQELQELSKSTNYSVETINSMYTKFSKLDKEEKGYVSISDLAQVCDFENSEVSKMIFNQLSCGLGDQIDFRTLVHALSHFQNNIQEKKLRCKPKNTIKPPLPYIILNFPQKLNFLTFSPSFV